MSVSSTVTSGGRILEEAPSGASKGTIAVFSIFYLSILTPVIFHVGTISLPPPRLFLLVMLFPLLFRWLSGGAGGVKPIDFIFVFICFWMAVSFLMNRPFGVVYEKIGYYTVETLGGFLLGRVLIRTPEAFLVFVRLGMLSVVFMLPFAIVETQTGDPFLIDLFSSSFRTEPVVTHDVRMGMERAQVIFPHPIHYGIFVAAFLGLSMRGLSYGGGAFRRAVRFVVVTVSVVASVSSGAFLSWVIQMGLMTYDRVLRPIKARWRVFGFGFLLMYVSIDLLSNRTPFHVFNSYMTLDPGTGYNRILIFNHGMNNVEQNPIFGLGTRGWARPRWMKSSVDNFWLAMAMRHGIPMFLAYAGAVALLMTKLSRNIITDPLRAELRAGFLVTLGGLIVALGTVHIWDDTYIWFMVFLGAGVWLMDPEPAQTGRAALTEVAGQPAKASRYTRFPVNSGGGAVNARGLNTARGIRKRRKAKESTA